MTTPPELYYFDDATCGLKARFALLEKQVPFVPRLLDRYRLSEPAYLAINPAAVVPTLVHLGRTLDESTVIGLYIDDAFEGPALRPHRAHDRATMYRWLKRIDENYFDALAAVTFGLAYRNVVLQKFATDTELAEYLGNIKVRKKRELRERLLKDGANGNDVRAGIDTLRDMLQCLNDALTEHAFAAGPNYSLADAFLTPFVMRLDFLGLTELWDSQAHVADWWDRMQARESFKQLLTESFPASYRADMQALVRERPACLDAD